MTETKTVVYNAGVDIVVQTEQSKKNDNQSKKQPKKRIQTEHWKFEDSDYSYENQMQLVRDLIKNNYNSCNYATKIALQQIARKIYGYKHQDMLKKMYNPSEFITLQSVVGKMLDCELKCYYCSIEMNVLYDISREMTQWTVDRIDNSLGHNITNYYIACLECNLKRRTRNDEKFLFTKRMKIIKT